MRQAVHIACSLQKLQQVFSNSDSLNNETVMALMTKKTPQNKSCPNRNALRESRLPPIVAKQLFTCSYNIPGAFNHTRG